MSYTISATEPRSVRAIEIAAGASAWIKCSMRGYADRRVYGVPSQRTDGQYHLTTATECSCYDFQARREPCKHVLAVRLHQELAKAQQTKPTRRPVLRMVRESEDVVSWERPARSIPSAAVTAALAQKYDAIFGGDE